MKGKEELLAMKIELIITWLSQNPNNLIKSADMARLLETALE